MKQTIFRTVKNLFKKKKTKSDVAMSDLLIAMNQTPNDYEFGAEARVIIQNYKKDLED